MRGASRSDSKPASSPTWRIAHLLAPLVACGLTTAPGARGLPTTAPLSAFAARKAYTLIRDRLPCLGCHTLHGEGGRIGPDLTTVGARRSEQYITAMIADPQATVPGSGMPKTRMPERTRVLLARYLASLRGGAPAPQGAAAAASTGRGRIQSGARPAPPGSTGTAAAATTPPDGAALFARWCSACHGGGGRGDGPNARYLRPRPENLTEAEEMSEYPDDKLFDMIAGGGAIMNHSHRMPSFGATLAAAEIRALVAHIRRLCRCRGPAWSRDGARR